MERLFNLLTELSIDPIKQEAFTRDPAGAATKAGLSAEEQALLAHWRRDQPGAAGGPWAKAAFCLDPGPDPNPDPDPPTLA